MSLKWLALFRHQHIPELHIMETFISMICHFRCCPRLSIHNTCRASDGSAGVWQRTWAGIRSANVGGVTISDPDCYVTVGVMFWFVYFSVVFFIHEIYIRRMNQKEAVWGSRYVISMYITLIIQLCQGKDSFPFYGTLKIVSFPGMQSIKEK